MSKLKKELKDWGGALLFAVLVATPLRWAIAEPYKIPTPSMEKSLLVGDFLLVTKYHYGARTAKTLLQIPLTFQKIWGTEIPSYLDWLDLPFMRLPGISTIKRNDPVVFNYPAELDNPVDMRTYYIKRCVAVAGDTIQIIDQKVYINGALLASPGITQSSYFFKTTTNIKDRVFHNNDITDFYKIRDGYIVHTTAENASLMGNFDFIQQVRALDNNDPGVFPNIPEIQWTADNFGPLYIPKKGESIKITRQTLEIYADLIQHYDLNDVVLIENGKLFIDGVLQTEYTFNQDYFFMMGDNRHNSLDSRYWGFVPMDHIVGKAVLTWFSIDENKPFLSSIRWNRIFQKID